MRCDLDGLAPECELLVEGYMAKIVVLVIGLGLAVGCGSSTLGGTGPDGAAPPNNGCAALGACACMAASDRCTARTEACYCPSECAPEIACICGGGKFLACEDAIIHPTPPSCLAQALRVQQQCAAQPLVQFVDDLCRTQTDPCVANCLANLGSCSEIDCSLCPACDCAAPQSPLSTCLGACRTLAGP
jgi:hypothetical protein